MEWSVKHFPPNIRSAASTTRPERERRSETKTETLPAHVFLMLKVRSGAPIRRFLTLTRLGLGHKVPPPLFPFSLLIHFSVVPGAAPWLSPGRRLRIPQVPLP